MACSGSFYLTVEWLAGLIILVVMICQSASPLVDMVLLFVSI
jgi:hypothetical protein